MARYHCYYCNKALPPSAPRVVIRGLLVCGDCAYLLDHPGDARLPEPVRVNPLRPQVESLPFGDAA